MPFTQTPIPGRKLQNVLPAGTALILEGGGLRGYYSAGVMEAFLEKDMLFPYIIGVSAGAANALSYISGQAMRSRQIIEHYVGNPEYVSRRNLLRKGSMFGFDYIFQTIPEQHIRFDWDAYNAQETRFRTGAMNCADGKTVWFEKDEITPPFSATVASCSVPILTKVQHFKGYDLLDGGTSDPIPIEKSIADGNRFHVVVLTRNAGYRKEPFGHAGFLKAVFRTASSRSASSWKRRAERRSSARSSRCASAAQAPTSRRCSRCTTRDCVRAAPPCRASWKRCKNR